VPTYQYACTACGHQLEAVQSFADDPLTQCPTCEGRLRKVFASVGIVFKGSGFYRTDSRTETAAGKAKAESSAEGASAETKPSTESKDSKGTKGSKDTGSSTTSGSTDKSSSSSGSKPTVAAGSGS
jgi:putative FmdB family regulatory protein